MEKNVKTTTTKKAKKAGLMVPVIDSTGSVVREIELPERIFAQSASDALIAQYMRVYMSNQHPQSREAKTRGEVAGSSRKIYRQKGTGNARHGNRKASLFVGGGVTHGPRALKRELLINKKQLKKVMMAVLSQKVIDKQIRVLDTGIDFKGKTKNFATFMTAVKDIDPRRVLLVGTSQDSAISLSARNMARVSPVHTDSLNAYDVITHTCLLMTPASIESLLQRI
ncbi:MAG: 50S ribosomal protein L4 [Microgenomates bacterium OLB22]|nr:MAG: 50S ribosomal protein L4 [Microgenomates bacterium OLB22]